MKKNLNKILVVVLAVALLGMTIVAGTLAYLHAKTQTITNTFTVGAGVSITLTETGANEGNSYTKEIEYIPALQDVAKDPTITVTGRECWVFVGVKVSDGINTFITYELDPEHWDNVNVIDTLDDGTKIYAAKTTAQQGAVLNILTGDQVDFNNVDEMPAAAPTMQFTGYAIQTNATYNTAALAWAALEAELTPPTP